MNRLEASRKAIEKMGGPKKAAAKINDISGASVSVASVKQWNVRGVSRRYAHIVSALTDVPISDLVGLR